ncbi:MAG: CTP-dependent riboflavin kinase [Candidatus Diapherotrites archaeon]|nr:CTP-dependent riboflavin kinase [Candidatus Diapherotrites archaeon]
MPGALKGIVRSGLEKGCLFLSMPEYISRLECLLGFRPFSGTLNIEVEEQLLEGFLKGIREEKIESFEKGGQVFGCLTVYRISFKGMKAAIIRPAKTGHPGNIAEIIAPVKLREAFAIKDGDAVEISAPEKESAKKKKVVG